MQTQNRLINPKKNPPKNGEKFFWGGEFLTIFNRFSRHDIATDQIFPPLFSLKFVDLVVI